MIKFFKKFLSLILILSFMPCMYTYAYSKPDDLSVLDYPGVIYDATKSYISSKNDVIFSSANAKIIFVITDNTDGIDTKTYTQNLYNDWGISSYGRANSIFILVSLNNNDYHFIKGKNLKYEIMDSEIYSHFINSFEPHFENKDYSKAVISLFNSLAFWYGEKYKIDDLNLDTNVGAYLYGIKSRQDIDISESLYYYIAFGVFLIGALIVFKIRRKIILDSRSTQRRRMRRKHYLKAKEQSIDELLEKVENSSNDKEETNV